jgi:hypothetical protein
MAAMHSGYSVTVFLNCESLRAVRQKIVMWGKAMAESGMNV